MEMGIHIYYYYYYFVLTLKIFVFCLVKIAEEMLENRRKLKEEEESLVEQATKRTVICKINE